MYGENHSGNLENRGKYYGVGFPFGLGLEDSRFAICDSEPTTHDKDRTPHREYHRLPRWNQGTFVCNSGSASAGRWRNLKILAEAWSRRGAVVPRQMQDDHREIRIRPSVRFCIITDTCMDSR
jgi:hypothetical protein